MKSKKTSKRWFIDLKKLKTLRNKKYSISEIAETLRCTRKTVYDNLSKNNLKILVDGRSTRSR